MATLKDTTVLGDLQVTGNTKITTPFTINTQTASYTLGLTDASQMVIMDLGTATTVTIPTNATVAFPIGTNILIMRKGAGTVAIAGAGVDIRGSLNITSQYSTASIIKIGTDEWVTIGDLS